MFSFIPSFCQSHKNYHLLGAILGSASVLSNLYVLSHLILITTLGYI